MVGFGHSTQQVGIRSYSLSVMLARLDSLRVVLSVWHYATDSDSRQGVSLVLMNRRDLYYVARILLLRK